MTINMNPPGGGSPNLAPTNTPLMELTNTATVEPTNTGHVELTNPIITVTPPRPTIRSTLTYNPTMDYSPTGATNNAFTPNMDYAPYAAVSSVLAPNIDYNPTVAPTMDYTPTRAASDPSAPVMDYTPSAVPGGMFAPNMDYQPVPGASNMFMFGSVPSGDVRVNSPTPNLNYTTSAVPGSMLAPNMDYKPVPGASNMFVLRSGPSGDVRVNNGLGTGYGIDHGMGYTSPSPTARTYMTTPNTPGHAIDNPRTTSHGKYYNTARIARGNARAAAHAANQASVTAAAPVPAPAASPAPATARVDAPAHAEVSRDDTRHRLSLLEESRRLHLKAFKEHSINLKVVRAELELMKASPDADSRVREIEDTESGLFVLARCVELYGRRFESLGEEIEEQWDALMAPPDDTLGTL
ncbi:MAG: hypothetical protein LQ347_002761 [Umbilicaria vellea]|nr:MAG: hypothetical protein LQ347_002761 [Umbilicaria vellea]